MLIRAERRIRERGWSNVTVLRADAAREPLGHNEYDAAVAIFSISAMPDVAAAVGSAFKALRPGGRLFVVDMRLLLTGSPLRRARTRLLRGVYRATAGYSGADVIAELRNAFGGVEPVLPSGELGTTITIALATKP
jgi:ubiquinone/menaquinone biosynthesis C-methylase UbiE